MRAVVQRVSQGSVAIDGQIRAAIGRGLVILLGVGHSDSAAEADRLAEKIAHLRIFDDEAGKINLSALDVGAEALVISQFTLFADCRKGRRPSFTDAAPPQLAEPLVNYFVQALQKAGLTKVKTGVFGAKMMVSIFNDGPVTIVLDTDEL